ncbi:MAG: cysteine synthase A [Clostridia bacterium]|nr:cysteine synthase A [Clostridia bacterium]
MKIYNSVTEIVGGTPLLRLKNIEKAYSLNAEILAKLEYLNPAGSIKDRAAKFMIEDAEQKGVLKKGMTIVEPTSGNTGIGLAAIAAAKGYKVILTMPETMSEERRKLIALYGAEIVLTDGKRGMTGAIEKAEQLARDGGIILGQFKNQANAEAHRKTTGPEIWNDTEGKVDILVAGVGTGGTLTGAGEFLKSKNPAIKVVAVEPSSSPVLSKGEAGAHKIQGIGAGFVPEILNTEIYDEVFTVSNEDAYLLAREVVKREGILVGISSGAALYAATQIAIKNQGKKIVVVFPDSGDRYLSVL